MERLGEEKVTLWDEVPGYDFIEEVDVPAMHSWFLDGTHSVPPWTPLFGWFWIRYCSNGSKFGCDYFSTPTCKGWEMRYKDGGSYNALIIVRDEKEIAEREVRFREAMRPYIEDFDGLWEADKQELLSIYGKLKAVDVENASDAELYRHNHDLVQAYKRMWEIHFLGMYSSFNAWLLLEVLCKEQFGITDQDAEFQDMMRGFDNKVYQMDRRLSEFGQLAVELGLEPLFSERDPQEIVAELQQSESGQEWFGQFMDYLRTDDVGGWRMRRMNEFLEPYWLEEPSVPIGIVKDFVLRGGGSVLEDMRQELAQKREKAIAAFLEKVPQQEKDLFEGLIRLAGKVSSYSEEHDLYCELYAHALIRRGYLAIGRRLAEKGTIDKTEDVFFLNPDEIERVMMVPEAHDLRFITKRRGAAWEEWQKRPNPPLITDRSSIEEAVGLDIIPSGDAIAIKAVMGELPVPRPDLKADLRGICGCPGEAEGIARVCINYEDLVNVKVGEILVCPGTNPAWTTVFGIVKAIVSDSGGTLSHTATIGREYGVPTIVNTFVATATIKTGQRLRVDATNGAIYILE